MRKGNMTTLTSIFVIALVAAGIGMGTMAFFSDTETSGPNVMVAGTIDLTLTGGFDFTDVKPCEDLTPVTVLFENVGQNPGYLWTKIEYINYDKVVNGGEFVGDITANEFAALIYVKAVTYQHYTDWEGTGWGWGGISDDLPNWLGMDLNGDGYLSLYEMKTVGWIPYCDPIDEPLIPEEQGKWVITFHMADSLLGRVWGQGLPTEDLEFGVEDNAPQADGISVTWTFVLLQNQGPPA